MRFRRTKQPCSKSLVHAFFQAFVFFPNEKKQRMHLGVSPPHHVLTATLTPEKYEKNDVTGKQSRSARQYLGRPSPGLGRIADNHNLYLISFSFFLRDVRNPAAFVTMPVPPEICRPGHDLPIAEV